MSQSEQKPEPVLSPKSDTETPRFGGWQPMDTAPQDGTSVHLAWSPEDWTTAMAIYRDGEWVACPAFYDMHRRGPVKLMFREYVVSAPMFWKPLPPPPESGPGDGASSRHEGKLRDEPLPSPSPGGEQEADALEAGNREMADDLFQSMLKWLRERDLYDPRDYFHDGITADDIIELLDEHENALASPVRGAGEEEGLSHDLICMADQVETFGMEALDGEVSDLLRKAARRLSGLALSVGGGREDGSARADLSRASSSPSENPAGGDA